MATPRIVSDKWFVFVNGPETWLRDKLKVLMGWIDVDQALAVAHVGGKKDHPHMHMILSLTSKLQKQSFDIRIKKLFEIVKKTDWSTKPWDGEYGHGAGSYMYHEGEASPVLCNKGFTELHIEGFKTAAALVDKIKLQAKEKANTKLIDFAMEHFAAHEHTSDLEFFVYRYMLKRIKDGENYHPGDYLLKRYVQEVVLRLCPADKFDDYALRSYEKLFPIR